MGIVMSKVFAALFGSKEVRILILGLDNAGKTTILCTCDVLYREQTAKKQAGKYIYDLLQAIMVFFVCFIAFRPFTSRRD